MAKLILESIWDLMLATDTFQKEEDARRAYRHTELLYNEGFVGWTPHLTACDGFSIHSLFSVHVRFCTLFIYSSCVSGLVKIFAWLFPMYIKITLIACMFAFRFSHTTVFALNLCAPLCARIRCECLSERSAVCVCVLLFARQLLALH